MEKVLSSRFFAQSRRLQLFLEFLVTAAHNGDAAELKEFVIAQEVYGRGAEFDPKVDSIVRTEASRLRKRLEDYYASTGSTHPVRFELPKGAYVVRIDFPPAPTIAEPPIPRFGFDAEPSRKWTPKLVVTMAGFGLAAIALLVAGIGRLLDRPVINEPKLAPSTVLSALPGYQLAPSLSPDGKQLAFVWTGTGLNYDIYVKSIDTEAPRRLTTDGAQDLYPAWSPDAREIAFLRSAPAKKEIFIVPSAGGPERKIAEIQPVAVPWVQEAFTMRRNPGPAWSPGAPLLAISDRCDAQESSDCIYALSTDGLQRRRITSGAAIGDYAPAFSPDGKQIAFLRTVADMGIADIYIQPVAGGPERRLTSDGNVISAVAWPAGGRIFFVSKRSGNNLLWSIAESGGDPQAMNGVGRQVFFASAASHANAVAYTQYYRNVNIWRTDLQTSGAQPELLIGSSRVNHSAQYSPDGSKIVFFSDRSGQSELWVARADGSSLRRLTSFSGSAAASSVSFSAAKPLNRPIGSPNWSPDGKRLVYDSLDTGRSQIYIMNADGGGVKQFTIDAGEAMMPTWSRDGLSIYCVLRRNGALSLWKKTVGGAKAIHISDGVASDALESADGKRVFFSKSTPGIWEAASTGGDERLIPELARVVDSRYCFVDRQGIYFLSNPQPPWEIQFFDFTTRRVSRIANISKTPEFYTRSLSISPGDRWMLHTQVDQVGSEIMMVSPGQTTGSPR